MTDLLSNELILASPEPCVFVDRLGGFILLAPLPEPNLIPANQDVPPEECCCDNEIHLFYYDRIDFLIHHQQQYQRE